MAERQDISNQISLDLLLRRLGTTVLRLKFKEIYAKLNDGVAWTDGPEAGKKFIQSKWGSGAFVKSNAQQQEMLEGGTIQQWDLHCLQSVITQMLTAALNDIEESSKSNSWKQGSKGGQPTPVTWDNKWWGQMSKIRQLANIRHSVAHMPNEALSQGEFDEKWDEAVNALKALGAKRTEINEIRQMSQSAFSPPGKGHEGQGHGQLAPENCQAQSVEEGRTREEGGTVEELQAKFDELELQSQDNEQVKGQVEMETKNPIDDSKGQQKMDSKNVSASVVNRENELRANSLMRKANSAGRSRDWNTALESYTQALEIPNISDDQRRKIFINRSCVHLGVLKMPEFLFNFNRHESDKKSKEKVSTQIQFWNSYKFLDKKLFEKDYQNWPEKVKEELKEFHLTAGMADAESALQLSPGKNSLKALYHLAQFHQLKGDWNSALIFFDRALDQSDLDDYQLEFNRNVCQLELLNQTEVKEFYWVLGKKNQTMAGISVLRNPQRKKFVHDAMNDPEQKIYAQVIKAHFLAQGLPLGGKTTKQEVTKQTFEEAAKLYEWAGNGGLPSGFYNLGLLLQEGNGVQRDFSGAVRLFKMAAHSPIDGKTPDREKEGVLEAQYRLGLCYEFGLGVGKDDKKALHWYEMASEGNFARASRKLGDIYSQGLLGVSKDEDMAIFCRNQAAAHGDTVALTSGAVQFLKSSPVTWVAFRNSIFDFSRAIALNCEDSTPFMLAAVLDKKRNYQSVFASVLQEQSQFNSLPKTEKTEDREPKDLSWNVSTLINDTLHTIHLLELAQTPAFKQKLEAIPDWKKQFYFTERLVSASDFCAAGLTAFQELNKMYLKFLVDENKLEVETDYPPDLQKVSGIDPATLVREAQLVTVILTSFASSLRLVGAVYFQDHSTQALIQSLLATLCLTEEAEITPKEAKNFYNSVLLYNYTLVFKCAEDEKSLKRLQKVSWKRGEPFRENWLAVSGAAVQGSFEKFEDAVSTMREALNKLRDVDPWFAHNIIKSKWDLHFVQALCLKSAALARGVNSANRKKVKGAMDVFQEFLSICPKDEPRRAEAHYQLGLCALYLEKMKFKGQVKSSAKDILNKVLPHFTQGEAAEQDLPWKEFPLPQKSPVKLLLKRKIQELESFSQKFPAQNLIPDFEGESTKSESSCFGRLLDPYYKFPISGFPLKLRGQRRVKVITQFRSFFKAAHSGNIKFVCTSVGSPPSLIFDGKLSDLLRESPYSVTHVITDSWLLGCYEIVEPVLHFRITFSSEEPIDALEAFTVVQDESGAVFNLQAYMTYQGNEDKDAIKNLEAFQIGGRIIINKPCIRLDPDGGTSLVVQNADLGIYHVPSTSKQREHEQQHGNDAPLKKCGYCGQIGETLQRCAKCQKVYYCDKECQKTDWNELKHKWICPFLM